MDNGDRAYLGFVAGSVLAAVGMFAVSFVRHPLAKTALVVGSVAALAFAVRQIDDVEPGEEA